MRLLICFVCCFWHSIVLAEVSEVVLFRDALSIHLPDKLGPMPQWKVRAKYPGAKQGIEAYSSQDGTVSIVLHLTQNAIHVSQVDEAHIAVSHLLRRRYEDAHWLQSHVEDKFDTRVMVLEFVTQAKDTRIHNLMYGIPVDGRLLLVTFNATLKHVPEWLERGRRSINSIKLLTTGEH